MAAYFARRLLGGAVTFFLSYFILYTLLIFIPGGLNDRMYMLTHIYDIRAHNGFIEQELQRYGLHKPYPLSYLVWWFNPDKTKLEEVYDQGELVAANEVPSGHLFGIINGSGALTGDLGESTDVERGRKVTDVLGPGLGVFIFLAVLSLPFSMTIVLVQRRRRSFWYEFPKHPRRLLPRRLPYRTNVANELYKMQFGVLGVK